MFSECIRGTRRLRSLSDLRARPARTSPLTCMFADRIPRKVRNAGEARAAASLAARFGRQTEKRPTFLLSRVPTYVHVSTVFYFSRFISILLPLPCSRFMYLPPGHSVHESNALTLIYIAAWLFLKNAGSIADGICIHRLLDRIKGF